MPSKHTLNVSLTNEFLGFISQQVSSGRFRTSSEVVRAALRLLEKEANGSSLVRPAHPVAGTAKAKKSASRRSLRV
ncbi:type II toxin-antitoxin system ParD family antitoxin [Bradyrhizobium sp. 21]|uniref:type II toxin-antitoxin system ParD family antitoxin n=1 Tax=Bradyrhizobium sp. 21 TaxID=2782666 RepID=UPI001FF80C63|nr:type II toxin-antitoxin system ParD family antitoxin [Bradyrhizobium sp. 21]MCK1383764.1 type II toxin-antitoxin system ParD family antitoxin [Bradyrhizobium sp. 21]